MMNTIQLYLLIYLLTWLPCFCDHPISQKVVICGVCRNIEKELPFSKTIIERIGTLFSDYRVVIYENNSNDSTSHLLKSWSQQNPKIFVKSENLTDQQLKEFVLNISEEGQFFRPELIARARNEVLDIALSKDYEDFPYLIWIDMDFVKHPDYEAFINIFQSQKKWDAVFSYGIDPDRRYWDWYAYRSLNLPFGPEMLGMKWYRLDESREKDLVIVPNKPWIPVYSAFGGCGIYKKSSIAGCRYSGTVTKDMESLAQKILQKGIKSHHPQTLLYLEECKQLTQCVRIDNKDKLKEIKNDQVGIILSSSPNPLIWRMNTFTYHYPSVCEHVPFHASMIEKNHGKLFIYTKLLFYY
jgi:hypothetical protein